MTRTTKYLTLVILFLISISCSGQKIFRDSSSPAILYSDSIILPKPDTIKVIMLVCDTTRTGGAFDYTNPHVYWMLGHLTNNWGPYEFLDPYKKPLSKKVIVWQYKIIKP